MPPIYVGCIVQPDVAQVDYKLHVEIFRSGDSTASWLLQDVDLWMCLQLLKKNNRFCQPVILNFMDVRMEKLKDTI